MKRAGQKIALLLKIGGDWMEYQNYKYYGYNSQDEYEYYNRRSIYESENIAAICFALILVMVLIAAIVGIGKATWAFIHMM